MFRKKANKKRKVYDVEVNVSGKTLHYQSFYHWVENNGDMRFVSFYTTTGSVMIKSKFVDSIVFREQKDV